MNEPLFKNRFVRDEKTLKEVYKNHHLKSKRFKIIYTICILIQLFSTLFNFGFFLTILFYNVIVAILLFFSYHQNVKIAIKRDKEITNGKELLIETVAFDDRIEADVFGIHHTLDFDTVDCVNITENYVIINTKARFLYILKKDSFTLGNSEGFVEFLKSKGLRIVK